MESGRVGQRKITLPWSCIRHAQKITIWQYVHLKDGHAHGHAQKVPMVLLFFKEADVSLSVMNYQIPVDTNAGSAFIK